MKLILLLTALLFMLPAHADVQLKYGMVVSDNDEPHTLTWVGIWGETNNCDYCVALFAVETYRKDVDHPRDRLVGADYVIKYLETDSGVIRTNLGFALSEEPLQGGETFNFHFGLSLEGKKVFFNKYSLLFSYDHFSNGMTLFNRDHILVNEPLDLMSIGIGF